MSNINYETEIKKQKEQIEKEKEEKEKEEKEKEKEIKIKDGYKKEINEYKKILNELRKSKKISNENYNLKLKSFNELINIDVNRNVNPILGRKSQINSKYANLLTITHLPNLPNLKNKIQQPSLVGNIKKSNNQSLGVGNKRVVNTTISHQEPVVAVSTINNRKINIISNLINKIGNIHSKIYPEKSYLGKSMNSTIVKERKNAFKEYVKESIKSSSEIKKIIIKNNLTTDEIKIIREYIDSKYQAFNYNNYKIYKRSLNTFSEAKKENLRKFFESNHKYKRFNYNTYKAALINHDLTKKLSNK
jgi:hypothetical protein